MAVPSHAVRSMTGIIRDYLKKSAIVVSASKGLELGSFKRMSQVLTEELPKEFEHNIAVLSGPSHAEEVIRGIPTAVVAASLSRLVAEKVQNLL